MKQVLVFSCLLACVAQAAYKPAEAPMMTPWGERVTVENAWQDYPRPNLVRRQWTNLNGLWQYAVTKKAEERPAAWQGQILVPFAIESALSGVGRLTSPDEQLWYRRTFTAAVKPGERLLLHFGGVDFRTQVFLNGVEATDLPNESGNLPFTVDITDFVKAGENELVLSVWDPTDNGSQSRGKQALRPGGCFYTRMSGIWQTVWMEAVPAAYIAGYTVETDIDKGEARVKVLPAGELMGATAEVAVMKDGREIAKGAVSAWSKPVSLKIPSARLWSPESPNLYDLRITLSSPAGKDEAKGYFGMRKIECRKDERGVLRFYLNNTKTFLMGTLDQGWWPDGLLTPPSEEAMVFDIEFLKKSGFNCMRKHIKIEPLRYYYLCDKLGMMVWQDMPSGSGDVEDRYGLYRRELSGMINLLQTFPSIVMWVPYNEGWGQPKKSKTDMTLAWVKRVDPTRVVNAPSGWTDYGTGDTRDMHRYPGPAMYDPMPDRVSLLGEFGGLGYIVKDHAWSKKGWGYVSDNTLEKSFSRYQELMKRLARLASTGLAASIYTQTTDVEDERNGLLTYDRKVVKYSEAALAKEHAAVYKAAEKTLFLEYHELVPTSEKKPQTWKYTFTKPADGWQGAAFDDAAWMSGFAGFGNKIIQKSYPEKTFIRTAWETPSIWLRRTFDFQGECPEMASMKIFYDEDCFVYLNGELLASFNDYNTRYTQFDIDMSRFRKALKKGKNVLAVSLSNKIGGAYFDIGIDTVTNKK